MKLSQVPYECLSPVDDFVLKTETDIGCVQRARNFNVKVSRNVSVYQKKFIDVDFSILVYIDFAEYFMQLLFCYVLSSFLSRTYQKCSSVLHYFIIVKPLAAGYLNCTQKQSIPYNWLRSSLDPKFWPNNR